MFEIYDDDDLGLPAGTNPLPRLGVIDAGVMAQFAPAYIAISEISSALNPRSQQAFISNLDPDIVSSPPLTTKDVTPVNLEKYWYAFLFIAYQPDASEDSDPDSASTMGITVLPRLPGIGRGYSTVFVETVREAWKGNRFSPLFPVLVDRQFKNTIAHELGHLPIGGSVNDHAEEGIMAAGSIVSAFGESLKFTPPSLKRFRANIKWTHQ